MVTISVTVRVSQFFARLSILAVRVNVTEELVGVGGGGGYVTHTRLNYD